MTTKFVTPELAYKYILEQDTGLNKLLHPILQVATSRREDGVYAKISADQLPCTKLLFKDDCIILSQHNSSICYPIDLSQETWQRFMAGECGKDYVSYLAMLEEDRHEEELSRIFALNKDAELDQ